MALWALNIVKHVAYCCLWYRTRIFAILNQFIFPIVTSKQVSKRPLMYSMIQPQFILHLSRLWAFFFFSYLYKCQFKWPFSLFLFFWNLQFKVVVSCHLVSLMSASWDRVGGISRSRFSSLNKILKVIYFYRSIQL